MQVRFGPFEVDEASGKLLKHGLPIPLREQPFQILVALLERPGELVSRQELHRHLWHERTLVDFELGLDSPDRIAATSAKA
jgi:DNA-binding winged helix-turn-helix (wHTH) protein